MCVGLELSNFGPSIKDDAVPTVRKADAREIARAAQSVQRTTADEPDQTGCHAGPTIHFDRPRAWAERRAGAMGWGRSLSKFGPSKDDAVPMGEQSMCRSCGGLGGVYEVTTDAP
jgi:hypothetical protein